MEHIKGQLKQARSENRKLKREIAFYKKRAHFYEETIDEVAQEVYEEAEACPECKKGTIVEHDFTHIVIKSCTLCDYKKRVKPRSKK